MVIIIVLLYICARDLRSHTISNRSVLILSVSMLCAFSGNIRWVSGLLTFLGLLVIGVHLSLGGGDIKLISSLVLFADINFDLMEYLEISIGTGTIHLLIDYAKKGRLSGNIALAPTICLPLFFSLAFG